METELLKAVGQIAGLGGIALGFFTPVPRHHSKKDISLAH
jgi:hypothetical protein